MRQLTNTEIETLASRKGARRIAVENFLSTMGEDAHAAAGNLAQDAASYGWNGATRAAIAAGIRMARKPAPSVDAPPVEKPHTAMIIPNQP